MEITEKQARMIEELFGVSVDEEKGKYMHESGEWVDVPLEMITAEFINEANEKATTDFEKKLAAIVIETSIRRNVPKYIIVDEMKEFVSCYDNSKMFLEENPIP